MTIAIGAGSITSWSRLSTYQRCPRKFRYHYIDQLPEASTPVALIFGSAVHEAYEAFFKNLAVGRSLDLPALFAIFSRAFKDSASFAGRSAPVDWGEEEAGKALEEHLRLGERMLAVFLDKVDRSPPIIASELEFHIDLRQALVASSGEHSAPPERRRFGVPQELKLRGFIDLVLEPSPGRYLVVDYKTAAKAWSEHQLRYDMQPTVYLAAAEHLLAAPGRVEFQYWVLTKTKNPAFHIYPISRGREERLELLEALEEAERAVDSEFFPRRRDWQCAGCQYAGHCSGDYESSDGGPSEGREGGCHAGT